MLAVEIHALAARSVSTHSSDPLVWKRVESEICNADTTYKQVLSDIIKSDIHIGRFPDLVRVL